MEHPPYMQTVRGQRRGTKHPEHSRLLWEQSRGGSNPKCDQTLSRHRTRWSIGKRLIESASSQVAGEKLDGGEPVQSHGLEDHLTQPCRFSRGSNRWRLARRLGPEWP